MTQGKENSAEDPLFYETVVKSGSHLLVKILGLLKITHKQRPNWGHLDSLLCDIQEGETLKRIFPLNKKYCALYRDPRDMVISRIFHYKIRPRPNENPVYAAGSLFYQKFNKLSMSQLIDRSLNYQDITSLHEPGEFFRGTFEGLEMALLLKQSNLNNVLMLRFEDLIRPEAGGSPDNVRFHIFKKICRFSNKDQSDERIRFAMKNCWGDKAGTFRKDEPKKVGQWKKYFKPHHIKIFQEKYNHLLLGLGYETDPNWHLQYLSEDDNVSENKDIENITTQKN